jgi:hypothetical protein
LGEWVTIETEVVTIIESVIVFIITTYERKDVPPNGGHVVWLTGVSHGNVVAQNNSLLSKELEVGYVSISDVTRRVERPAYDPPQPCHNRYSQTTGTFQSQHLCFSE